MGTGKDGGAENTWSASDTGEKNDSAAQACGFFLIFHQELQGCPCRTLAHCHLKHLLGGLGSPVVESCVCRWLGSHRATVRKGQRDCCSCLLVDTLKSRSYLRCLGLACLVGHVTLQAEGQTETQSTMRFD